MIKLIQKQYPSFGVQMTTTDISFSGIKLNISVKNTTEYTLYKNNQKTETFKMNTITDLNIMHVAEKNTIGEMRNYPLFILTPSFIQIGEPINSHISIVNTLCEHSEKRA
ncbi:hypothetical protein P4278_30930 [Bacillus thuringiensis]|nr:hypothetical protein [Bacillus thuringiensis]MED2784024.1 hypothetical protein [Bacillus thuringiensis]